MCAFVFLQRVYSVLELPGKIYPKHWTMGSSCSKTGDPLTSSLDAPVALAFCVMLTSSHLQWASAILQFFSGAYFMFAWSDSHRVCTVRKDFVSSMVIMSLYEFMGCSGTLPNFFPKTCYQTSDQKYAFLVTLTIFGWGPPIFLVFRVVATLLS